MEKTAATLFVDLDGTLIKGDLFVESALSLLRQNPLNALKLLGWLAAGREVAKAEVAARVPVDAAHLPYHEPLLDYLRAAKEQGRRLILATASDERHARAVAEHVGLFDDVIASTATRNLKGARKLEAIQAHPAAATGFAYAGDSPADRPIWQAAASGIYVAAPSADVAAAEQAGTAELVIKREKSTLRAFVKEMRVHQWAKNSLVFVPLFTSHSYDDIGAILTAVFAMLCFSLCASGVYFLNDLLDIEADRRHHRKRFRPLASGDLPLKWGVAGALGLPLVAFVLALLLLNAWFVAVMLAYYTITNMYSFGLKRISTADVMTLAVLFTIRVIAGAVAIEVELSSWLMGFSVFTFVSLAYLKRYIEVAGLDEGASAAGRGYSAADRETMFTLGVANMTAAVLVLALFVSSDEVAAMYETPQILWLLCLLMLYWGNRIWVGARRNKINDDPVVFAIKDNVSRAVGVAFGAVVLSAKYVTL